MNSTNRRRTRAIQSVFSTPLSIEILAPAERANHSSGALFGGQVESGENAPVFRLRQRPKSFTGVAEQYDMTRLIPSAYFGVKLQITPVMVLDVFAAVGTK